MTINTDYSPQNFKDQFEEENKKFKLSSNSEEWKKAINEIEDNSCLDGKINFLLEYSKDGEQPEDLEKFKKCADNAVKLLSESLKKDTTHELERLLLNDKDSCYPCQLEENISKSLKTKFKIQCVEQFTFSNKSKGNRDFGWHRLLNDDPNSTEHKKKNLKQCQDACKKIISSDNLSLKPIVPSQGLEEWKKLLICCPALIDYCSETILYKVTYNENQNPVIYLSTGTRDKLLGYKKNKISELYTRYIYEMLGGKDSGWEYKEWMFTDESACIDSYLKKENVIIRHNANGWSAENTDDDFTNRTTEYILNYLKSN